MGSLVACCALVALMTVASGSAHASFPGGNGKIAYSTWSSGDNSIWNVDPDGSGAGPLTTGTEDRSPTYSADGKRIAFVRDSDLYVMNADGSGQTLLRPGHDDYSSDTKVIADFEDPDTGDDYPFVRVITYNEGWDYLEAPAFSADGASIAATHRRGERFDESICALETAESSSCIAEGQPGAYYDENFECAGCVENVVSVSSTTGASLGDLAPLETSSPAYSSDGKFAYVSEPEGSGVAQVVVVSSPGAPPVVVYDEAWVSEVDFSPDGTRLLLSGENSLRLVGAGGGAWTPITVPPVPGASEEWLSGAVFSPDGTRLAFAREAVGAGGLSEEGIFTMGVDGSGLSRLVDRAYAPSWQPLPIPPPAPISAPAPIAIKPPTLLGAKKGPIKLDKKGKATISTIACGSSDCKLKVLSAKLKIEKESYAVKAKAPKKLAAGKKGKVKVKVKGKALAALKEVGKGKLTTKLQVTDAAGKKTLTLKSTLTD